MPMKRWLVTVLFTFHRRAPPCSSSLFRLVRPHLRPLSIDPFPDEGRTVSECAAVGFDDCQEPDGVAIDQIDALEIDGEGAAVRPERGTKDVQVFPLNSPTYVQDL